MCCQPSSTPLLRFLEHVGELWGGSSRKLPSRGTQYRVRKCVTLPGRDLRPDSTAARFLASLPSQAIVRVEHVSGEDGNGLWVRPTEPDMLRIVPPECRAAAAACGYAFEVPPGIMLEYFETLPSAT